MNFLKSLFSTRRFSSAPDTNKPKAPKTTRGSTVAFPNLLIDDSSPQAEAMDGRKSHFFVEPYQFSGDEADSEDDTLNLPEIYAEASKTSKRIRGAEKWTHWVLGLLRENHSEAVRIAYVQYTSAALYDATRYYESYHLVTPFVDSIVRLHAKSQFNLLQRLRDHSRKRRKGHKPVRLETIQFMLSILWRDGYHFQCIAQKMKFHITTAQTIAGQKYTRESFHMDHTHPKITNSKENLGLQHHVAARVQFTLQFTTAALQYLERNATITTEIQNCTDAVCYTWFATALTCLQKLQYPMNGPLPALVADVCRNPQAVNQPEHWVVDGCKVPIQKAIFCPNKTNLCPPVVLSTARMDKLMSCALSVGLMYISAFQKQNQQRCAAMHKFVHEIFTDVEVGLDVKERLLFHRHANFVASVEERLYTLVSKASAMTQRFGDDSQALAIALALFEWLRRAGPTSQVPLDGMLSAQNQKFVLYNADALDFDGRTAEALALYGFVAMFSPSTEIRAKIRLCAARGGFSIEYAQKYGRQRAAVPTSGIFASNPMISALASYREGKLTAGQYIKTAIPLLKPYLPCLRADDAPVHAPDKIASIPLAHDITVTCCVLGDIFLERDDPRLAMELFLAALKIVTLEATFCCGRMLIRACEGISRAQGDAKRRANMLRLLRKTWANVCDERLIDDSMGVMQTHMAMAIGFERSTQLVVHSLNYFCSSLCEDKGAAVAVLVPQSVARCRRAYDCTQFMHSGALADAFRLLRDHSLCPFAPALFASLIEKLPEHGDLEQYIIDALWKERFMKSSASDIRCMLVQAAERFHRGPSSERIAKLLLADAGKPFDSLGDDIIQKDHALPAHVSCICVTADPNVETMWLVRQDTIRGKTHSVAVPLPDSSALNDLFATFNSTIRRNTEEIRIPYEDNNNFRLRFWKRRRFFNDEIGLLIGRLGRILGPLEALFLGLPADEKAVKSLWETMSKIAGEVDEKKRLLPYILSIFVNFLRVKASVDGGAEPNIPAVVEALQCIGHCADGQFNTNKLHETLKSTWARFGENGTKAKATQSTPTTRKVWLLVNHPLFQSFPLEKLPIFGLAAAPVVRITSLHSACALASAKSHRNLLSLPHETFFLFPPAAFYCLNASNNMQQSEDNFTPIFTSVKNWTGITRSIDAVRCIREIFQNNVYIYIGHGAGENCTPRDKLMESHKEANLELAMLTGCSSTSFHHGAMHMPNTFRRAGSGHFIGTLWDVTSGEIDRFTTRFIRDALLPPAARAKVRVVCYGALSKEKPANSHDRDIFTALREAQFSCRLPYLTGASVVLFGY